MEPNELVSLSAIRTASGRFFIAFASKLRIIWRVVLWAAAIEIQNVYSLPYDGALGTNFFREGIILIVEVAGRVGNNVHWYRELVS